MTPIERNVNTALMRFLKDRYPEFIAVRARSCNVGFRYFTDRRNIILYDKFDRSREVFLVGTRANDDPTVVRTGSPRVDIFVCPWRNAKAEKTFSVHGGDAFKQQLAEAIDQVDSVIILERI